MYIYIYMYTYAYIYLSIYLSIYLYIYIQMFDFMLVTQGLVLVFGRAVIQADRFKHSLGCPIPGASDHKLFATRLG